MAKYDLITALKIKLQRLQNFQKKTQRTAPLFHRRIRNFQKNIKKTHTNALPKRGTEEQQAFSLGLLPFVLVRNLYRKNPRNSRSHEPIIKVLNSEQRRNLDRANSKGEPNRRGASKRQYEPPRRRGAIATLANLSLIRGRVHGTLVRFGDRSATQGAARQANADC